jgi:hydrogenase nickel incorporation protein HypB
MSSRILTVKENILAANTKEAEINRELLNRHNIGMINIMSSPGSGKTSLILQTIRRLRNRYRIAVIEGDIASSMDTDKITVLNIPAVQINTSGGCHLDARMTRKALGRTGSRRG